MKTSDVLSKAADEMNVRGHLPNGGWIGRDLEGSCCIGGAIAFATQNVQWLSGIQCWAVKTCSEITTSSAWEAMETAVQSPHNFNEVHTKEEVIAMLRAVAATERAREARLMPAVREAELAEVELRG